MSIQDDFASAGQAYAAELRATTEAKAQAKLQAEQQRQQTISTGAAWLQNSIDQLDAERPEPTKDAANNSDDFNAFFKL